MSSCFFIGHRETVGDVYPQLEAAIEQHIIQFSVREFIVGNYGGFGRSKGAASGDHAPAADPLPSCPAARRSTSRV